MARLRDTNLAGLAAIREYEFICLGCKSIHRLPKFTKVRNLDRPTVRPDVHFTVGPFKPGHEYAGQTVTCHFRITDGTIRYFTDSTHSHKGKTVGLPDFDELEALQAASIRARAIEPEIAEMPKEAEETAAPAPAGRPD